MSVVFTPSARRYGQAAFGLLLAFTVFSCARARETAPSSPASAPPESPAAATPPAEQDKAGEAPAATTPSPEAAPKAPPLPAPARPRDALSERRREESEGRFAEPPPTNDLRTAEADLERYRSELEAALSPARSGPKGGAAASRGAAADDAPGSPAKKASDGGCSTACRAFSSLGRAATAVCRIAGEKDARCTRAHEVVAEAEKRVAVCGCRAE